MLDPYPTTSSEERVTHPRCACCGHVGNRAFLPDRDGVLRDVLTPGIMFIDLAECSNCGSDQLEPSHEQAAPREP
jgi:hypothetical protein